VRGRVLPPLLLRAAMTSQNVGRMITESGSYYRRDEWNETDCTSILLEIPDTIRIVELIADIQMPFENYTICQQISLYEYRTSLFTHIRVPRTCALWIVFFVWTRLFKSNMRAVLVQDVVTAFTPVKPAAAAFFFATQPIPPSHPLPFLPFPMLIYVN